MDNYTLTRADRATHLKIMAISLLAGILVVGIGFAARAPADGTLGIDANAFDMPKPVSWLSRERATLR
jgi:hypothetical protein